MRLSLRCRIALFLISCLLAVALPSIPLNAAEEIGAGIRAGADEVRIAFAATDPLGRAIKSLRSSDVAVADNGSIIRRFRSFQPASETPLDVVLLLDVSGSVRSQLPMEVAAAKSVLEDSGWQEGDRVSIVACGGIRPQRLCARNCREDGWTEAGLEGKLNELSAEGSTPLYDALVEASDLLRENPEPEARQAILLFSDGMDTISMNSLADALRAAQSRQAAIYAINLRSGKSSEQKGDAVLGLLAEGTGGLSFGPGKNIRDALGVVLDDLHSGYVLTYDLPEPVSGEHSVRLLPTRDPRLQLRSRQAYDGPPDE